MPRERTTMEKIREILRMHECEISKAEIARALKVSRPTVDQYLASFRKSGLRYAEAEKMGDEEILERLAGKKPPPDRYRILAEKFPEYAKELKRIGVTLLLLWEEYIAEHPGGYGRSQFCHHYREWSKRTDVTMHMEHKAGDKLFVDYAGKKFKCRHTVTGEEIEMEVFVAVLGASRLIYAEATPGQKKEDWIRSNENAFQYIGGVTRAVVPDNLKSGVTKSCKYEPHINPDYADFARYHGTTILPARPNRPKDKALVENAVDIVYERVYAPLRDRTFSSPAEVNLAFREKLEELNNRDMQKLKISRRRLFEEVEKAELMPLPSRPYEFKKFLNPAVQRNYHFYVSEDRHYYSVPYAYKGRKIKVIYTENYVEAYFNGIRIAHHKRDRRKNRYTTSRDHMPSNHRFYDDWSPEKFINKAGEIGEPVQELVRMILDSAQHPEQAYKSCQGVIKLQKNYGIERLNDACARALRFNNYSYKAVKNILEKGLDQVEEEPEEHSVLPVHENIRGETYYETGEEHEQRGDTGENAPHETARNASGISGDNGRRRER